MRSCRRLQEIPVQDTLVKSSSSDVGVSHRTTSVTVKVFVRAPGPEAYVKRVSRTGVGRGQETDTVNRWSISEETFVLGRERGREESREGSPKEGWSETGP